MIQSESESCPKQNPLLTKDLPNAIQCGFFSVAVRQRNTGIADNRKDSCFSSYGTFELRILPKVLLDKMDCVFARLSGKIHRNQIFDNIAGNVHFCSPIS